MPRIDAATLEHQTRRLCERAAVLRDEVVATLERSDDERYTMIAGQVRDREDDSFADLIVEVNLAEVDRDVGELRAIDAALTRIKDGRYGVCAECGGEIARARLDAEPSAIRCIRCQEAYEHQRAEMRPRPASL